MQHNYLLGDFRMKKKRIISVSFFQVAAAALSLLLVIAATLFTPMGADAGAVRVGERAPQFEIQGFNSQNLQGKKNLLLVFYRGLF